MPMRRSNLAVLALGGSSLLACESGSAEPADAVPAEDGRVPDSEVLDDAAPGDASPSPDVGEDAAPEDGDADAVLDAAVGKCSSASCPLVTCLDNAAGFPEPLQIKPRYWAKSFDERIEALIWRLDSRPPGSSVAGSAETLHATFSFTPDLPGDYTWCLRVRSAGGLGREYCCRSASLTEFAHSLDRATSTRYLEDVEFVGGWNFVFDTNQPFDANREESTLVGSSSAWAPLNWSYHIEDGGKVRAWVPIAAVEGDLSTSVRAGDSLTLRMPGQPRLVGAATTLEATITLEQAPEPEDGPRIEALVVEATARAGGIVRVKFDPSRIPGGNVGLASSAGDGMRQMDVRDDGAAPDTVAGDGWFTGRYGVNSLTKAGTYSVLARPYAGAVRGAYFRTTIVLE